MADNLVDPEGDPFRVELLLSRAEAPSRWKSNTEGDTPAQGLSMESNPVELGSKGISPTGSKGNAPTGSKGVSSTGSKGVSSTG